jgi:hypothetical protein
LVLPPGALMLTPVPGPHGSLRGAILIYRVRTTAVSHDAAAARADLVGGVIGKLMATMHEREETQNLETSGVRQLRSSSQTAPAPDEA